MSEREREFHSFSISSYIMSKKPVTKRKRDAPPPIPDEKRPDTTPFHNIIESIPASIYLHLPDFQCSPIRRMLSEHITTAPLVSVILRYLSNTTPADKVALDDAVQDRKKRATQTRVTQTRLVESLVESGQLFAAHYAFRWFNRRHKERLRPDISKPKFHLTLNEALLFFELKDCAFHISDPVLIIMTWFRELDALTRVIKGIPFVQHHIVQPWCLMRTYGSVEDFAQAIEAAPHDTDVFERLFLPENARFLRVFLDHFLPRTGAKCLAQNATVSVWNKLLVAVCIRSDLATLHALIRSVACTKPTLLEIVGSVVPRISRVLVFPGISEKLTYLLGITSADVDTLYPKLALARPVACLPEISLQYSRFRDCTQLNGSRFWHGIIWRQLFQHWLSTNQATPEAIIRTIPFMIPTKRIKRILELPGFTPEMLTTGQFEHSRDACHELCLSGMTRESLDAFRRTGTAIIPFKMIGALANMGVYTLQFMHDKERTSFYATCFELFNLGLMSDALYRHEGFSVLQWMRLARQRRVQESIAHVKTGTLSRALGGEAVHLDMLSAELLELLGKLECESFECFRTTADRYDLQPYQEHIPKVIQWRDGLKMIRNCVVCYECGCFETQLKAFELLVSDDEQEEHNYSDAEVSSDSEV